MSAAPSLADQLLSGRVLHAVPAAPVSPPTEGELAESAALGDLLREFLAQLAGVAILTTLEDDFALDWTGPDGERRHVQAGNGRDLLLRALGREPVQRCLSCGRELPLSRFGLDRHKASGRMWRCKPCEAIRVRAYKARKARGETRSRARA